MKYLTNKVLFWMAVMAPAGIFSQEEGMATATITDEYCVTIDASSPITDFYEIDIAHLGLASEQAALDKMGYISNNLLTYTVDFEAEKAFLQVHLDRTTEPKDIIWWSEYINSLCGL